jgi:hypothetical protein
MNGSNPLASYVGFDGSGVMCYNNLNVPAKVALQGNMTELDPTYECIREGTLNW